MQNIFLAGAIGYDLEYVIEPDCKLSAVKDSAGVNMHGDTYKKNDFGQIIAYKYKPTGVLYSFVYDADGHVCEIESSNAWTWKRMRTGNFDGWLIRNCFDRWHVNRADCHEVFVGDGGIHPVGGNVSLMVLPDRN